jgi:dihydropteroate synthase
VSAAPRRELHAAGRVLELGERPWLMGIVNATPDSFSDGRPGEGLAERVARARDLMAAGADIIDIGGESAITNQPPVPAAEELARVVPLVEAVAGELGAVVSIDTYKPEVAEAAIAAGAAIVNDVSGLRDPRMADVCARTGAALVIMHTAAPPKVRRQEPDLYGDVREQVERFLGARMDEAVQRGVAAPQIMLDPGPDFAKTPAQTIVLIREVARLHALGRPLLMALSRKDFIGAITGQPPSRRLAGTLAALDFAVRAGGHVFRLHDVAAARDFLAVAAALEDDGPVDGALALADELRHEPRPA